MSLDGAILLGHGSGGALWHQLLADLLLPVFTDMQCSDGAVLPGEQDRSLVFTTDSFVVHPHSFPGGDIGALAVHGTVNDLAMMCAEPSFMSCSLILEEGFPIPALAGICRSMQEAAADCRVKIVTGDTKVVGHGEADGIFINTAGIGYVSSAYRLGADHVQPGDIAVINGGLGEHGAAILAVRMGIGFEPPLATDSASLWPEVSALIAAGIMPRVMRDLTRGGLASAARELAEEGRFDLILDEGALPVDRRVAKACEIWGIDPLHLACEGRFLAFFSPAQAEDAFKILKGLDRSGRAAIVGRAEGGRGGRVVLLTETGGMREVRPLSDEMLPRIC